MSIVLAHQPHFADQSGDVQVFWGYSLFPDRVGNFVAKPMSECNGTNILQELCGHLRFDPETVELANCIPCRMPYITIMFMPRSHADRPLPVPRGSKNLAFISQFVEIQGDVVFTVEYSVRPPRWLCMSCSASTARSQPYRHTTSHFGRGPGHSSKLFDDAQYYSPVAATKPGPWLLSVPQVVACQRARWAR